MKEIIVKLSGCADGLSDMPKKIEFVLQIVMHEIKGDCDFSFNVDTESANSDVREPHIVKVTARRCYSRGYGIKQGIISKGWTVYKFNFTVPSYTLENIYVAAKEALKNAEETKYEEEITKQV